MKLAKVKCKGVDLIDAIEGQRKKLQTQSLDISFNELVDMVRNHELDISPDYQRLFQWSEGARSRFIESLLLEMPVPPIYVVEDENGVYLLIDGLQRISSYLHMRGELEASHLDPPVKRGSQLTFQDCDIVRELNGCTFDSLSTGLQIRLKRAFVRVEVVRRGSDPKFKYHMFKRLNTGGEILSSQQLRNCTIRLLDPVFNDFIIRLSGLESYCACTEIIGQPAKLAAFDQELVLRFFALKNSLPAFKHDVSDFLTEYMEQVSDPDSPPLFDYEAEEAVFEKTFKLFHRTLDRRAFAYANKSRKKITNGFSVLHFEAFTIGVQACLSKLDVTDNDVIRRLKTEFENIKYDEKFYNLTTGGGKNSPGLLKARINYVRDWLARLS